MINTIHGDCLEILRGMADASVDSIVTDPPYGLAFMGKRWDYNVPSEEIWRECLRVLKPGGHLLAFAGTRTQHRMAVRIEDAGFEIRDMIAWVYGSGFPKSLDVSKAIDKLDASEAQQARRYRFTEWVRSTGLTSKQIDEATGTNMGGHYTTAASQPAIMTREHLDAVRHLIGDVPEWVEREADIRSVESQNFKRREVVGTEVRYNEASGIVSAGRDDRQLIERKITAPATPEAQQWQGFGTALKPALEPITLARKPLVGTVAANVLKHGTGALNIDECRIEAGDGVPRFTHRAEASANCYGDGKNGSNRTGEIDTTTGRWPANLIHDGSEEVVGLFPESNGSGPARKLKRSAKPDQQGWGMNTLAADEVDLPDAGNGSAARFFYCAKASKADRDEGLDAFDEKASSSMPGRRNPDNAEWDTGNDVTSRFVSQRKNVHPTVKPTDLMRYLCRLVTPPGGTVLDPFMGSGSTGKAAVLEGFNFIGIEREAEYVEIAKARIACATQEANEEAKAQSSQLLLAV